MLVLAIFGTFHVFIRSGGGASSIADKYTFLCPYLTYGVPDLSDTEKCQTLKTIEDSYTRKNTDLEENIVDKLSEYIPIKITRSLLVNSPERAFVEKTYASKLKMDEIMNQFEAVRKSARSLVGDNIVCNGISIADG